VKNFFGCLAVFCLVIVIVFLFGANIYSAFQQEKRIQARKDIAAVIRDLNKTISDDKYRKIQIDAPSDPWGNEYVISYPADNVLTVQSLGPDGLESNDDIAEMEVADRHVIFNATKDFSTGLIKGVKEGFKKE
jgi:hypothetical protein